MSLKYINSKGVDELTTAKEIALAKGLPFDVTSRVLQIMSKHLILESCQGVQGGYKLIKNLSHVDLFSLIEMIDGPQGIVKCISEGECGLHKSCNVNHTLLTVNNKILNFYKTISLAEAVGSS